VALTQAVDSFVDIGRWPTGLGHPPPRPACVTRCRWDAVLHPYAQIRLIHDSGVPALEPVIPPAHRFLKKADVGPRVAHVRIHVAPGPDQPLTRHLEVAQQPENAVGIAVRPAANPHHRALHRREILTDGTVAPVIIPTLVGKPVFEPQATVFQPIQPHAPPLITHQLRIRGHAGVVEHR